jgi:hypothetical protein
MIVIVGIICFILGAVAALAAMRWIANDTSEVLRGDTDTVHAGLVPSLIVELLPVLS